MQQLTLKQQSSFDYFSKLKIGAIADETGCGKTRIAIELLKYNIDKFDICIFMNKNSEIDKQTPQMEFKKWQFMNTSKVIFLGYETLSQSDRAYLEILKKIENKRLFIICDESIFIKNENKRYNRLMEIAKKSEYRLILNATLLTNNLFDIYNQMNFLSPKILNMNRDEFNSKYFKEIILKKNGKIKSKWYELYDPNLNHLMSLINPYIISNKLNFDKEEKEFNHYNIVDSESENDYQQIKNIILNKLHNLDSIIAYFTSLLKINACNKNKNKEIAEKWKNQQVIIFCNFIEEERQIDQFLDGNCYLMNGLTHKKDRKLILDNFQKDNIPLIITLSMGGFSGNYQFCNKIVFSSLTFNYGHLKHAKGRIKRLGQEQDIEYHYYKSNLKIQNLIDNNLEKKQTLLTIIKENLTNLGEIL